MMIMNNIKSRMRSDRGETLVELLISLLISSLAMMILATMIVASTKVIERGEVVIERYTEQENKIVKYESKSGPGEVALYPVGKTDPQKFSDYDSKQGVDVEYYENDKLGRNKVITYKHSE